MEALPTEIDTVLLAWPMGALAGCSVCYKFHIAGRHRGRNREPVCVRGSVDEGGKREKGGATEKERGEGCLFGAAGIRGRKRWHIRPLP